MIAASLRKYTHRDGTAFSPPPLRQEKLIPSAASTCQALLGTTLCRRSCCHGAIAHPVHANSCPSPLSLPSCAYNLGDAGITNATEIRRRQALGLILRPLSSMPAPLLAPQPPSHPARPDVWCQADRTRPRERTPLTGGRGKLVVT